MMLGRFAGSEVTGIKDNAHSGEPLRAGTGPGASDPASGETEVLVTLSHPQPNVPPAVQQRQDLVSSGSSRLAAGRRRGPTGILTSVPRAPDGRAWPHGHRSKAARDR